MRNIIHLLILTLVFVVLVYPFSTVHSAPTEQIIVNSFFDVVDSGDNSCTLREAIIAANRNLPSGLGLVGAQVKASLSKTSIAQDEPVTVTFESDAQSPGAPDLSALEQDFRIVHRSTNRSRRSFNGRTTQRTAVTLTLLPKRSGDLVIPSL